MKKSKPSPRPRCSKDHGQLKPALAKHFASSARVVCLSCARQVELRIVAK